VVEQVKDQLNTFRIKVDERTELTPGFKFNDWEMRGVPLRLEIGPKDVENGVVTAARRDIPGKVGKTALPLENLDGKIAELLMEIHASLFEKATRFRDDHIFNPKDYAELTEVVQNGWAYCWWCGDAACETKVKEDTKATTRCIPLDQPGGKGRCIVCGKEAAEKVYFARAY
jgi:prolyl-tRNA synthetase